jgi:hypothetical protein
MDVPIRSFQVAIAHGMHAPDGVRRFRRRYVHAVHAPRRHQRRRAAPARADAGRRWIRSRNRARGARVDDETPLAGRSVHPVHNADMGAEGRAMSR